MPEAPFADVRHAGALVPLFSIPSRESWGIGERYQTWRDWRRG